MNPTSTIAVNGWMLQSVNKSISKNRAQALTDKGNEHAHAYWGERTSESAEFTLGGAYTGNMTLPTLGGTVSGGTLVQNGITDYTVTYSETEYPKLSVTKDSAAGGGSFALPFTLPARALGVPSTIADVYTNIGTPAVKSIAIAVSCQHFEETNGSGVYGTLNGMTDATVQITFTGIDGKPAPTMATGWDVDSSAEGATNVGLNSGSVTYVKHFPIGTDTNAENYVAGGGE